MRQARPLPETPADGPHKVVDQVLDQVLDQVPVGPVELLIVQASPFCNIDCRYCYLPDRQNKSRMAFDTLAQLVRRLVDAPDLLSDVLPVSWHAGEPMALPADFYEQAFEIMVRSAQGRVQLTHAMQTNGTRMDERWLNLIKRHRIRLGVSLDGPAFLHDRYRVTRRGQGTHATVMQSVRSLQDAGVPFHVIAVVTRETLAHPDAFYDFFADQGMQRVALNVEEVELHHAQSSLGQDTVAAYRHFLARVFQRSLEDGRVNFRELVAARGEITRAPGGPRRHGQQTRPFGIVSCDHMGNVYTFSPELVGARSPLHQDFIVGNVHHDSFADMRHAVPMQRMLAEIQAGIDQCEATCDYFALCQGGAPANKFFENGRFDSTETLYCRHTRQAVMDAALTAFEHHLFQQG